MTKRKFYQQTYFITLLSGEALGKMTPESLQENLEWIVVTDCKLKSKKPKILDGKKMAKILIKHGYDPRMTFDIDKDGNDDGIPF